MRILVVEDDPMIQSATCCLLESWGFEVRVAASVADALGQLDESLSHLLCDINLPDGLGSDVIYRAKQVSNQIRTVAITANDDSAVQSTGWKSGADQILIKPALAPALRSALRC